MEYSNHKSDLNESTKEHGPHIAWKARFGVGLIMLGIALCGLLFTDIEAGGAWDYWWVMTPVYALLSLGLSLYLHRMKLRVAVLTIWHEVLHWAGLLLAVYVVSLFVGIGLMSRFLAGLDVLLLLALAVFLAGVYIEPTFILIGIVLGLSAVAIAFIEQYLGVLLPLIGIATVLAFWVSRRKHKKKRLELPVSS